jgi:hypothetical protein
VIAEAKMGGIDSYPTLPPAGSPLKAYQAFLFWAAGAGRDFLRDCVEAERFKYECVGALICLTATLASFSMYMAVWLTWQQDLRGSMLALPIALLWGILIFTIDRFMVSSLRADAAWPVRLWQAAPRLLLAVVIGVIISRPIEIKIFEKEIMKVIHSEITRNVDAISDQIEDVEKRTGDLAARRFQGSKQALVDQIDGLEERERTLSSSLARSLQELADLRRRAQGELDGTAGSGVRGDGNIYELKQRDVVKQEQLVEDTKVELATVRRDLDESKGKLEELEQRIQDKGTELAEERAPQVEELHQRREVARDYGFLELNLALHRLAQLPQFMPSAAAQSGAAPSASNQREVEAVVSATLWGITLLFITIEVLPILTKLMAPAGQYDEKMQSAPYAAQMLSMQEMVAAARARASFLEHYEHANSAFYRNAFERLTGDDGRTDNVIGALWEHLRGGLDETLIRLRDHQRPFSAERGAAAETVAPPVVATPPPDERPKCGSRLGGRVVVSVMTTTFMFFVSYYYCRSQGIEFQEAINAAAAIAGLAFPLLTTILLRRSSSEK